jgi:hypothetical protein
MLTRIILALIVAVAVGLLCILLGSVLASLNVPITDTIGSFLRQWGWVIGVLAGLWYFFSGQTWPKGA